MTAGGTRWAAGVAEAAWLAALVVSPLYVDVAAEHPFEPTKAAAIRVLAVIAAAAFVIDTFDRLGRRAHPARGADRETVTWLAAVGLLALVQTASTLASLAFATSLYGSVHRGQGLTTLLAYLTLGTVAALSIRRREQVERALTCAIVAAVPVAVAAIAEHHGWMLLPRETPPRRAASTLGNPMALGGYLVLVVPLGVARVTLAVRTIDASRPLGRGLRSAIPVTGIVGAAGWVLGGPIVGAAIAVVLTAAFAALPCVHGTRATRARLGWEIAVVGLLLGALVAAGSRGAAVGGAAGALIAVFVVGAPRVRGWSARRFTAVAVAAVGLIASGVVVVRLTGDRVPLLGRFNEPLEGPGSTVAVRTTLWRTAVDALRFRVPVRSTSAEDGLHWLRPVIGHGPETTEIALGPLAPADLWQRGGRAAVPDRVHGGVLEAALQTGALGLMAQLAVFTIAVIVGVRALSSSLSERPVPLVVAWLAGGAAGVALALVVGRPELAGIALLVGMIGGLLLHLALNPPVRRPPVDIVDGPVPRVVVLAALAGILGHAVEVQFAFGWVTTMTYAWFALALLIAAGRPAESYEPPDEHRPMDGWATALLAGVALALVVHGLGHADRAALGWVLGITVLGVLPLLRQQPTSSVERDRAAWHRSSWSPVAVFVVTGAALVAVGRLAVGDGVIRFTPPIGSWAVVVIGLLVLVVLVTGALLALARPIGRQLRRQPHTVAIAGLGTVVLVWSLGVTPLQAELMRGRAHSIADPIAAIGLFERAQRTEPAGHRAAPTGVTHYLRAAWDEDVDDARAATIVSSGIALVEAAHSRSLFDAHHAIALAELYEIQAGLMATDTERVALLDAAAGYQQDAVLLRPAASHLRADLAAILLQRAELVEDLGTVSGAGDRERAVLELRHAERLDPDLALVAAVRARFDPTWSSAISEAARALDQLADRSARAQGVDLRARRLALEALDRADSVATDEDSGEHFLVELRRAAERSGTADVYLALAEAHTRRGETDDGLIAIRTALALTPPEDVVTRSEYRRVEAVLGGGSTDGERPIIDLRSD